VRELPRTPNAMTCTGQNRSTATPQLLFSSLLLLLFALLRRRQANRLCHRLDGADEGRDQAGGYMNPPRAVVPQSIEPGRLPDEMLCLDAKFVVAQVRSDPSCDLLIACSCRSGSLMPDLSDLGRVWRWCIVWHQLPSSEERNCMEHIPLRGF
jgi:hypothetical protein